MPPSAQTDTSCELRAADLAATSAVDADLLEEEPEAVAAWRLAGTLHLDHPAQLSAGDPCTTPITVSAHMLAPGNYQWQVRDSDEHGQSVHRVAEVRLIRVDDPHAAVDPHGVPEWGWTDDYGHTPTQVAPECELTRFVGIDTATLRWEARPEYTLGADELADFDEDDADDYARYETGVSADGQVCATSTGWGDGGYPIACRIQTSDTGTYITEARANFLTPAPASLSAAQFLALLPGAFTHDPLVGQLELTWECSRYRTKDTPEGGWHGYDRLVSGVDAGRRDMEHIRAARGIDSGDFLTGGELDDHTLAGIAHLWDRLPRHDRTHVAAAIIDTDHRDLAERLRGSITSYVTFTRTVYILT